MGNATMFAYFPIALLAITAVVVAAALADAFVRFGNAWGIARRELAHIDADLTFETRQFEQMAALRRPARPRPIVTFDRLAVWRAPLAFAA